jgi:hypothetical protein
MIEPTRVGRCNLCLENCRRSSQLKADFKPLAAFRTGRFDLVPRSLANAMSVPNDDQEPSNKGSFDRQSKNELLLTG